MNFLSDVIIWWRLRYCQGCHTLCLDSLNTHNKQRAPWTVAAVLPFPLPFPVHCVITRRQMVWVWVLPPHANIRHALNVSHILIEARTDRQFTKCCFFTIFIWLDSRNDNQALAGSRHKPMEVRLGRTPKNMCVITANIIQFNVCHSGQYIFFLFSEVIIQTFSPLAI